MYPNTYGTYPQQTNTYQQQPGSTYPQQDAQIGQTTTYTQAITTQDPQLAQTGFNYQYGAYGQYGYSQFNPQYAQQGYMMGFQQVPYGYNSTLYGQPGFNPQFNTSIPQQPQVPTYLPPTGTIPTNVTANPVSNVTPPTHSAFSNRKRKRSPDNTYSSNYHQNHNSQTGYHQNGYHSGHGNRSHTNIHPGSIPKRQVRISNIPEKFMNSPDSLKKFFSRAGRIMCINVPHYHDTGKPRNYAFVKFSTQEEATRACNEFNGKNVHGSVIDVVIANKQAEYSGRTNTIQVENLDYDAQDNDIRTQFSKHGEIVNFKLVKHHKSRRATAIIEYRNGHSVQSALNEFHDAIYVGEAVETNLPDTRNKRRKLEVSDSNDNYDRDSSPQKNDSIDESICEVYVGRLPQQLNSNKEELQRIFEPFGDIDNIDIIYDHTNGLPKGIAYIRYKIPSAASQAIKHLNQSTYYGRAIIVQSSKRQQQTKLKAPSGETPNETEIYIANIPAGLTENDIRNDLCNNYNFDIESVHITEIPPTVFIKFQTEETASLARSELNDTVYKGRTLFVRNSLSTDSREIKSPLQDEKFNNEIHVGNLPYDQCSESILRKIFSICGEIINIRLPAPHRHSNVPRGFAFVQFSDSDSAMRAISLHGKIVENRAINVSFPNIPSKNATKIPEQNSITSTQISNKDKSNSSQSKTKVSENITQEEALHLYKETSYDTEEQE